MLGPRPGARKRNNKLNVSGLGRSLVNQQKKDHKSQSTSDRYTSEINPYGSGSNLQSVTEQRPLDELLSTAELSGKDFTTERTAAVKVVNKAQTTPSTLSAKDREQLVQQHYENAGKLTVPRRPKWSFDTTPEELNRLENDAYLAWRRSLAAVQENPQFKLAVTPFERNIEVWRQLWRVVERCELIVQIVDARNPLFFRSEDLDDYARSFGTKNTLLLINKADLLTSQQRKVWKQFFDDKNISFAFFSARESKDQNSKEVDPKTESVERDGEKASLDDVEILSVDQLEALFKKVGKHEEGNQLSVGLVGYPNVGKSSTINALVGAKKVSVSSTPGKTKHFQTINLTRELMLCDCPGLVFPNFAQTKAELVCQGVLPIDQLRDYMSPVALVTERIPKSVLESVYHVKLHTNPVTALDLLETYAKYRGFTRTGGGMPDSSRAARIVLKDYLTAKLTFRIPPPTYKDSPIEFNYAKSMRDYRDEQSSVESIAVEDKSGPAPTDGEPEPAVTSNLAQLQMEDEALEDELDRDFFAGSDDRGTASLPFHLRGKGAARVNGKASKKHNKGRKNQG